MIKAHFPYAVTAVFVALLAAGMPTLGILEIAFAIAVLPLLYARDAAEIARRPNDRDH